MKMTMHIDEGMLAEAIKITGASSKTKAVEMALREMTRRARLKAVLSKGSGVSPAGLADVYDPKSLDPCRVAEDQAPYGKRRSRR